MALNAKKNWRANYLRALNIFTPDLATPSRPRHTQQTTTRPQSNRRDTRPSRRRSTPAEEKEKDKDKSYVFGLRSHLFRARRLAPSEITVDHVSAPIEIPTGPRTPTPKSDKVERNSERRSNEFQSSKELNQPMQLLSWEEPSVMLGNEWPLESEKRNSGVRYSGPHSIAEECEDTEEEVLTTEDDDDDIFKMEFDDNDVNTSSNVFRGKREKERRTKDLQRRPGRFDDLDDRDVVTPLSASFVPPHQMVERGCFSLGLRDELKRKPSVHKQ
ncbi:hypothetical protein PHMEG_0002010 [Phytophthora megakarya]|uniref:Uncharacterized protein n=1 Tax=Phytophthora megakarya TaxID=4795 RepID=A0A225WZR4_9STRA|nr:hypothetical protein PHMEG_0002010 [Phytophthora megakarya]